MDQTNIFQSLVSTHLLDLSFRFRKTRSPIEKTSVAVCLYGCL